MTHSALKLLNFSLHSKAGKQFQTFNNGQYYTRVSFRRKYYNKLINIHLYIDTLHDVPLAILKQSVVTLNGNIVYKI